VPAYDLPYYAWETTCPHAYDSANRQQCYAHALADPARNEPDNCEFYFADSTPSCLYNSVSGFQQCTALSGNGTWHDEACSQWHLAVCQRYAVSNTNPSGEKE
jgi:hypothetical protein